MNFDRTFVFDDIAVAIKNVDFVHTDVWVSMGEPIAAWCERIELLMPYRVTASLLSETGNPHVKFMYCLPAFHNCETKIGQEIAKQYPALAKVLK